MRGRRCIARRRNWMMPRAPARRFGCRAVASRRGSAALMSARYARLAEAQPVTPQKGPNSFSASAVNARPQNVSHQSQASRSCLRLWCNCLRRHDFCVHIALEQRGLWNGVRDCFHDRKLWVVRCLLAGRRGFEPRYVVQRLGERRHAARSRHHLRALQSERAFTSTARSRIVTNCHARRASGVI